LYNLSHVPAPLVEGQHRHLSENQDMNDTPDPAGDPKVRLNKEYEDPHFHDDDEVAPAEDGERRTVRPSRRHRVVPPPRHRRFHED